MIAGIFGLLGVILGSLLTGCKDWLTHRFKRRDNGRYAAVRLITVLDEYAEGCVSVVSDDGTCEGRPAGRTEQGEEYYDPQVTGPEPPTFPDDIDWQSINYELMYSILSFPNNVRKTIRYISASAEHASPPYYEELFDARQKGYAHLGMEAINLVRNLRGEFKIPKTPKKFWDYDGWDIEKFFQEKLTELQKTSSSHPG